MTKKPNDSCLRLLPGTTGWLITSSHCRTTGRLRDRPRTPIASGRAWTGTPNRPIISSGRDDRPQSTLPCCSSGPEPRLRQSGLASRQTHHLTNDCHALGDPTSHPAAASRRLIGSNVAKANRAAFRCRLADYARVLRQEAAFLVAAEVELDQVVKSDCFRRAIFDLAEKHEHVTR